MVKAIPVLNVNAGSKWVVGPTIAWYIRENKDSSLSGPYDWRSSDAQARYLSKTNVSGLAETAIYLDGQLKVIGMYMRGRKLLQGQDAQWHSDHKIPPQTPIKTR